MGYKPWRTLSVFIALGACTVGCTSGPQKSTGLGATNPQTKQNQLASQPTRQLQPGDQAPFNVQPQKQATTLPPFPKDSQFQQGNTQFQQGTVQQPNQNTSFAPGNRTAIPTIDEKFGPLPPNGNQTIQPAPNPLGGFSNPAAPVGGGFGIERNTPQPINLQK